MDNLVYPEIISAIRYILAKIIVLSVAVGCSEQIGTEKLFAAFESIISDGGGDPRRKGSSFRSYCLILSTKIGFPTGVSSLKRRKVTDSCLMYFSTIFGTTFVLRSFLLKIAKKSNWPPYSLSVLSEAICVRRTLY